MDGYYMWRISICYPELLLLVMVALPSQPTKCQKISSASSFRRECFIRASPWNGENENDPRPEFLWRYFLSFLRHDTQKGEKNICIVEWMYIRETRRVQHNTLSAHYLMCDGAFKISPVCVHTYCVCVYMYSGRARLIWCQLVQMSSRARLLL